jgi:mannitol-1-/sugar-/sorbitol-6-/2-deoxyglucose-6-phosphatase
MIPAVSPPRATAVIFDMDGVLIDSEPLWQQAELIVFRSLGVPLEASMCLQTMGLRTDEVVRYWHERFPWTSGVDLGAVERGLIDEVEALILAKGQPKPGVTAAMAFLRRRALRVALASSSPYRLIVAACEKLGLGEVFSVIHSAEDERLGKPHPGVYLSAAAKLGVPATDCVAIEDSLNGIIAAKAARMKCIAIPDLELRRDARLSVADLVLDSLDELEEKAQTILG